jgi:hypothetical protein
MKIRGPFPKFSMIFGQKIHKKHPGIYKKRSKMKKKNGRAPRAARSAARKFRLAANEAMRLSS